MSLTALCHRRSLVLKIAAASDNAGLSWQAAQTNSILFRERIATEQSRFALITNENLEDAALFTDIKAVSPHTLIVVCLTPETSMSKSLWAVLDALEFDILCTVDELTECLLTLKAGRFYNSSLLQTNSSHEAKEIIPGWHDLTPAERRVLKLVGEGRTGPQIANIVYICEKTVNNHKAKISQKLNIRGGPGSLTRFVLTHRDQVKKLLD